MSYKIVSSREVDQNELSSINEHYAALLGKGSYNAKQGVENVVQITVSDEEETLDIEFIVTVIKVDGHWYVCKTDGDFVENDFWL